jgi:hypothetical protein
MAISLANLENNLNNRINNLENNLNNRLGNIEARQVNAVASDSSDQLRPLCNAAGVPFANFTATLQDLFNMTGPQLTVFLTHYGLPNGGSIVDKSHRVKKFIGLEIA